MWLYLSWPPQKCPLFPVFNPAFLTLPILFKNYLELWIIGYRSSIWSLVGVFREKIISSKCSQFGLLPRPSPRVSWSLCPPLLTSLGSRLSCRKCDFPTEGSSPLFSATGGRWVVPNRPTTGWLVKIIRPRVWNRIPVLAPFGLCQEKPFALRALRIAHFFWNVCSLGQEYRI